LESSINLFNQSDSYVWSLSIYLSWLCAAEKRAGKSSHRGLLSPVGSSPI